MSNTTNLPKFKEFITYEIVSTVFPHFDFSNPQNLKLFSSDMTFELAPRAQAQLSELIKDKKAYTEIYKKISNFNHKNYAFTKEDIEQNEFCAKIVFSTVSFEQQGISFSILKNLSQKFNTEKIYLTGDGHDYELSEMTSDHSSEIVLMIVPEQKADLLNRYKVWYQNYQDNLPQKKKTI